MICRSCREHMKPGSPHVRTGIRHYSHWTCKLDRLKTLDQRINWLKSLHSWQALQIPVLTADRYELYPALLAISKAASAGQEKIVRNLK